MPLPITHTRPISREVTTRFDTLVVTLAPEGIYFREKGRRTKYLLPYGSGKIAAVQLFVAAEKRRKEAERKARRQERGQ